MNHPQKSHVQSFIYDEWPQHQEGQANVEFFLIYEGRLPAAGQSATRSREKHAIRRELHKQLKALWETNPFLLSLSTELDSYSQRYARCDYRFIPLVSKFFTLACELEILFLRRDGPGSIVKSGGDIDNRLKVLFDALRMPQTCDEVCGEKPVDGETPFFCLLEDDTLITKVQVETQRLYYPPAPQTHLHDVHLVIRVRTVAAGIDDFRVNLYSR